MAQAALGIHVIGRGLADDFGWRGEADAGPSGSVEERTSDSVRVDIRHADYENIKRTNGQDADRVGAHREATGRGVAAVGRLWPGLTALGPC